MLVKKGHLEPWHITDDGVTALCGVPIRQAIDQARSKTHAYGQMFCKVCEQINSGEDEDDITISTTTH